jgi:hypothetical protein
LVDAGRPNELTHVDRSALAAKGFEEIEVEYIASDLDRMCSDAALDDASVVERLERAAAVAARNAGPWTGFAQLLFQVPKGHALVGILIPVFIFVHEVLFP